MKDQILRISVASLLTLIVAVLLVYGLSWLTFGAVMKSYLTGSRVPIVYEALMGMSNGYYSYYYIAMPLTFCAWLELINHMAGKNDQQEK